MEQNGNIRVHPDYLRWYTMVKLSKSGPPTLQ